MSVTNSYNGNIMNDALLVLKNMTSEQLQQPKEQIAKHIVLELGKKEPPLEGETSFGVSTDWINWYARTKKVRFFDAVREGKRRLKAKENDKQYTLSKTGA